MKYIRIVTPENIEIEYRLAGIGSRLAAVCIDILIQFTATVFILWAMIRTIDSYDIYTYGSYVWALLFIFYFILYYCYFVICEMALNGQSIGKKLLKLRVIRNNGQPIGLAQSLVRNLFRAFLENNLIGLIVILRSKRNKRIGDMVAGTIVVSESLSYDPSRYSINVLEKQVIRQNQYPLTKDEVHLLREFISRKYDFPDYSGQIEHRFFKYFSDRLQLPIETMNSKFLEDLLLMQNDS